MKRYRKDSPIGNLCLGSGIIIILQSNRKKEIYGNIFLWMKICFKDLLCCFKHKQDYSELCNFHFTRKHSLLIQKFSAFDGIKLIETSSHQFPNRCMVLLLVCLHFDGKLFLRFLQDWRKEKHIWLPISFVFHIRKKKKFLKSFNSILAGGEEYDMRRERGM